MEVIVSVRKHQIFAFRFLHTQVPDGPDALVFLMDDTDTGIRRCKFIAKPAGTIGGPIVDQQDFQIPVSLGRNA